MERGAAGAAGSMRFFKPRGAGPASEENPELAAARRAIDLAEEGLAWAHELIERERTGAPARPKPGTDLELRAQMAELEARSAKKSEIQRLLSDGVGHLNAALRRMVAEPQDGDRKTAKEAQRLNQQTQELLEMLRYLNEFDERELIELAQELGRRRV